MYEGWEAVEESQQKIMRITRSLRELNQSFYHATRKDAEACGVTQIQYLALRMIKNYPDIGLNELADLMNSGASTASGVVERLVQGGWIVREKTASDRRAVILRLTPEGEELLSKANKLIMTRLAPLLELPDEDVGHLIRIHGEIARILQSIREDK